MNKKIYIISFLLLFSQHSALFAKQEPSKNFKGKVSGFNGDPALKRGYELGYGHGVKAGREDKKNGKKDNPTVHEEYKNSDKKFRAEYGSRSKFNTGYQNGFVKAYKTAYKNATTTKNASANQKNMNEVKKVENIKNKKQDPNLNTKKEKNNPAKLSENSNSKTENKSLTNSKVKTTSVQPTSNKSSEVKVKAPKINPSEDAL